MNPSLTRQETKSTDTQRYWHAMPPTSMKHRAGRIFWAHFWLRKISMNKFPSDNRLLWKHRLLHVMFTKGHGVSVHNIGVLNVIFAWILRDGDVIKADLLSLISKHAYLMWVCFVLAVEMFFANGLPCYGWFNYYLWRLVEWLQLVIQSD